MVQKLVLERRMRMSGLYLWILSVFIVAAIVVTWQVWKAIKIIDDEYQRDLERTEAEEGFDIGYHTREL